MMDIVTYYDERGRDGGSLHIRHYGPAPAAQAIVALQEVCESAAEAATGPRIINRGRSVAPMWWRAETVGDYATAGFATASILEDVAAVPGIEPIAFDRRRLAA